MAYLFDDGRQLNEATISDVLKRLQAAVHRKSVEARAMRTYLQARQGLVKMALAQGSRIRGLLKAHGLKLGEVAAGLLWPRPTWPPSATRGAFAPGGLTSHSRFREEKD